MYEDFFRKRLSDLRSNKGVSARDMSLTLGQNPGYINSIETGKTFPSMSGFFYICEYLEISPMDFFDTGTSYPKEINELISKLNGLDKKYIKMFSEISQGLLSNASETAPALS